MEESKVLYIKPEKLIDFPEKLHKFKPASRERLQELAEDITRNGVLSPIVVREIDPVWPATRSYQILAGHNRRTAAIMAGLEKVPCVSMGRMEDDQALQTLISDNLFSRVLLPSERGWAYRQEMEIRSRQGSRTDLSPALDASDGDYLTSTQIGRKLETAEIIGEEYGDSKNQVRRYIRLTYLIDDLLNLVDDGVIRIGVGVQLSYLSEFTQNEVYFCAYSMKPYVNLTEAQAKQIRELEQTQEAQRLLRGQIWQMLDKPEEKGRVRFRTLNWPMADLRNHYPSDFPKGISESATKGKILEAMRIYRRYTEAVANGEIEDLFRE